MSLQSAAAAKGTGEGKKCRRQDLVERGRKIELTEVLIMPPRETRVRSRFRFTDRQRASAPTAAE